MLHLSRKIILANLKIWCSKLQTLSGSQRPDLLTSLMNMSLVLRLPRGCIFPEPLQMSDACQRFWNCYKTITFFAHFWQSAESLVPATQNRIRTLKGGSSMRCFFNILTWKCASRDNGVHFFDIATSKGAPGMVCFVHFDFEMFFAP